MQRVAAVRGLAGEVHRGQGQGPGRVDRLAGFAVLLDQPGAQHFVAPDDFAQGRAEGRHVQFAAQPEGGRHVVGGRVAVEAFEKPQPPLREGQRQGLLPVGAQQGVSRPIRVLLPWLQ